MEGFQLITLIVFPLIVLGIWYFIKTHLDKRKQIPKIKIRIETNKGEEIIKWKFRSCLGPFPSDINIKENQDKRNVYNYLWNLRFKIINISKDHPAYNVKLLWNNSKPFFITDIKSEVSQDTVFSFNEEKYIYFKISEHRVCKSSELEKLERKEPSSLHNFMLLCQYENSKGKRFYTRFYSNNSNIEYINLTKKELQYWKPLNRPFIK